MPQPPQFTNADCELYHLMYAQRALREVYTIGVAEGTTDDMIGVMRGIAVTDGLVYYVDGNYSHVRAYNFEGHLVDIIGGPGEGPGEFIFPRHGAVVGAGDDAHVVVGSGGQQVSVFSKNRDGSRVFSDIVSGGRAIH